MADAKNNATVQIINTKTREVFNMLGCVCLKNNVHSVYISIGCT